MKYFLTVLLFCMIYLRATGSMTFTYTFYNSRTKISSCDPVRLQKTLLFQELLTRYNHLYHHVTAWFSLHFGPVIWYRQDRELRPLLYGACFAPEVFEPRNGFYIRPGKPFTHRALHFYCGDPNFDFQRCLSMLDYALSHPEEVTHAQRRITPEYFGSELNPLFTVREGFIDRMAAGGQQEFPELMNTKIVVDFRPSKTRSINYYAWHNRLCIYQSGPVSDTSAAPLLTLKNIEDIIEKKNSYLIFTDDRTFYELKLDPYRVAGPFTIPLLLPDNFIDMRFLRHYSRDSDTTLISVEGGGGYYEVRFKDGSGKYSLNFDKMDTATRLRFGAAVQEQWLMRGYSYKNVPTLLLFPSLILLAMLLLWVSLIAVAMKR